MHATCYGLLPSRHSLVQEADDLVAAMTTAWRQAARGEMPLVVATFITNTAFAAFEGTEHRLKMSCNIPDPEVLRSKSMQMEQSLELPAGDEGDPNSPGKRLVEAMQKAWHLLLKVKSEGPAGQHKSVPSSNQMPSHLIGRKGSESASTGNECVSVMLQNIGQHIQASHLRITIVRIGTPAYTEIGYFLTHDNTDGNGLRCSYSSIASRVIQKLLIWFLTYWGAFPLPFAGPQVYTRGSTKHSRSARQLDYAVQVSWYLGLSVK